MFTRNFPFEPLFCMLFLPSPPPSATATMLAWDGRQYVPTTLVPVPHVAAPPLAAAQHLVVANRAAAQHESDYVELRTSSAAAKCAEEAARAAAQSARQSLERTVREAVAAASVALESQRLEREAKLSEARAAASSAASAAAEASESAATK